MGLIKDEGEEIRRWRDKEVEEMGKWKKEASPWPGRMRELVGQGHRRWCPKGQGSSGESFGWREHRRRD